MAAKKRAARKKAPSAATPVTKKPTKQQALNAAQNKRANCSLCESGKLFDCTRRCPTKIGTIIEAIRTKHGDRGDRKAKRWLFAMIKGGLVEKEIREITALAVQGEARK